MSTENKEENKEQKQTIDMDGTGYYDRKLDAQLQQEQEQQQQFINLPVEQYELLKQAGDRSLASMLNTLDEYDEILGEALNMVLKVYSSNENLSSQLYNELLGIAINHTIQVYLRRNKIKQQIQQKYSSKPSQ